MDITPLIRSDRQVIQGYGPGSFSVSGQSFSTAIIVFPDRVERWDYAGAVDDLRPEDLQLVIDAAEEIDVVLFGCGAKMQFVKPALKQALSAQGVGLEAMDTGAACRTYNVLLAEGRRVAAVLLPL